jgi:group II intron reverse transcriptase/maturase
MAVQQNNRQRLSVPQGTGQAILALQSGLARKAVLRKGWKFDNLYPLLWRREWLEQALDAVLDNTGSETPGVDSMRGSKLREESARAQFVEDLQKELQQGHRPSPTLRKYIPKVNGGERPIGIPTVRDRVVQMTLKMILEPIFEADFVDNSNGFRPGRSTLECVLPMYRYGNQQTRYEWVIEGDIKGCFDNIDHKILMKAIRRRITDKRILRLIWCFLKAPVVEHGVHTKVKKGTPQGGVLSPLLANIYLNRFDQYWYQTWGKQTKDQRWQERKQGKASCVLFRYADDFILSVKGTREEATSIMRSIKDYFKQYLKLELGKEKTRVVHIEEGFQFLGFQICRKRLGHFGSVRIRPTQRNVARLVVKLQRMLSRYTTADDPVMKIEALNRVLRGWANYYKAVNAQQQFGYGDFVAIRWFFEWYQRKYQCNIQKCMRVVLRKGERIVYNRGDSEVELFRMSSLQSMHTPMQHQVVWKYRHIENPYLKGSHVTSIDEEDQPLINARDIHPIAKEYDEIYQINRLKAFERDGWRCIKCSERTGLVAHHIKPVPKGKFDPVTVHRVENLQTLCIDCHNKVPKRHSV